MATNLAVAFTLAKQGRRVLLIDSDPQWQSTIWGTRAAEGQRPDALDVMTAEKPDLHLRKYDHDLVLIDTPGVAGEMLRSALLAADVALVVMQPNYPDAWALRRQLVGQPPQLLDEIEEAHRHRTKPLRIVVALNRVELSTNLHQQQLQPDGLAAELPRNFQLLKSYFRDLTDFRVAFGKGITPLQLNPQGAAAADQKQLAAELLRFIQGKETKHGK